MAISRQDSARGYISADQVYLYFHPCIEVVKAADKL
jgi:hypothetical protein